MRVRLPQIQFLLLLLILLLPGCGSSDPFPALPTLAITSLNPMSQPRAASAGSPGFTLTVNGSGFISVSEVNFNHIPVTTTFVSDTQLDAEIPALYIFFSTPITSPLIVPVTVNNPEVAGGTSSPASFTVLP